MSSEETAPPPVQSVTQRLTSWLDPESAAVVTILFGLFQVLLAVPMAYIGPEAMPRFFILPLFIGILIVSGGSLAMANERNPSRYLLQGSACSNVVSLLGAVIAFCLYCVSINNLPWEKDCDDYSSSRAACSMNYVTKYSMAILTLLLVYDAAAIIMNCILSALSLRELKTN